MKCDVLLPSHVAVNVFVLSDVIIPPPKGYFFQPVGFWCGDNHDTVRGRNLNPSGNSPTKMTWISVTSSFGKLSLND